MHLFAKYNRLLVRRPLVTNMATTGFLFGSGDWIAQTFFSDQDHRYDFWRSMRATTYGAIVFAPIGDKWYKILSKVKSPVKVSASSRHKAHIFDTVSRVCLDQLVFAPFVGIPMYYMIMPFLELRQDALHYGKSQLEQKWWPTLKANWLVWPTFQLFNFYTVPVHFRLLAVNVISILWNSFLSYSTHLHHVSPIPEDLADSSEKVQK